MYTTYSFLDLAGSIAHPTYAPFIFTGKGIGSVNVGMDTEKTVHDPAADGVIMVSKIAGENGRITIECQQTSDVHKYLLGLYNYLNNAGTDQWAAMVLALRNTSDGTSHAARGVSFQKVPDKPYQAQGQKISWVLMAAEIINLNK